MGIPRWKTVGGGGGFSRFCLLNSSIPASLPNNTPRLVCSVWELQRVCTPSALNVFPSVSVRTDAARAQPGRLHRCPRSLVKRSPTQRDGRQIRPFEGFWLLRWFDGDTRFSPDRVKASCCSFHVVINVNVFNGPIRQISAWVFPSVEQPAGKHQRTRGAFWGAVPFCSQSPCLLRT